MNCLGRSPKYSMLTPPGFFGGFLCTFLAEDGGPPHRGNRDPPGHHRCLVAQRFALRLLPAYFLFLIGNLLRTDWFFGKVLFPVTLLMMAAGVVFSFKDVKRTERFLGLYDSTDRS
jgi:hypothetical protein